MKKRLLSIVIAVILAVGAAPAASAAQVDLAASVEATSAPATEPVTEPVTEPATEPDADSAVNAPREAADLAPTAVNYPQVTRIMSTANGLKLTWTAYPNAAKYMIFIRREDTGGWRKIGNSATTSFEHKDLVNDTVYTYTVRATDLSGKFISAANSEGYSYRWHSTPEPLKIDNVAAGQRFTWKPVEGAELYTVYLRSNDRWVIAGSAEDPYYLNTNAASGEAYTYTVRCTDPNEGVQNSYFDTNGLTAVYIAAPRITAFNAAEKGVTVTWSESAGASYYAIFQKTDSGWRKLAATTKTSYTHCSLTVGTTGTYTVRCMDGSQQYNSGYNARGWRFTLTDPPLVNDVRYKNEQYTIAWTAHRTAAYYRVFRKEWGGKWKYIGAAEETVFTDKKAQKTGVYTYTVRAMDANDNYLTYFTDTEKYYCMGIFIIGLDGTGKPDTAPRYTCEVTEDDLRAIVAAAADGWIGAVEGDEAHADILAYYNTYPPLAYSYKMEPDDAWCAAFTSAVWIRTGLARYICVECGCGRFIDEAKAVNIWVENDDYVPKVGDAIIYNWSDYSSGECTTGADHIGIVTAVNGNDFVVTEGNTGTGYVGTHDRTVNCLHIRGYIAPNYKQIAQYLSLKARYS